MGEHLFIQRLGVTLDPPRERHRRAAFTSRRGLTLNRKISTAALNAALESVAATTRVQPKELLAKEKVFRVSHARQEAMCLLAAACDIDGRPLYGFCEIGRKFDLHHTTVMHAIPAVERRANP